MITTKICEICSKEFQSWNKSQTCCSKNCKGTRDYRANGEKRRERVKEWYRNNIDKVREKRKLAYQKDPEKWKAKAKEYRLLHPENKKEYDGQYRDKVRHGGIKQQLVDKHGLVCQKCGKQSTSFDIVAHHITGDNQDHSQQELLCRACHCRLHQSVPKKHISKEQIEMAIKTTKNLDEACKILGINRSSLYHKRKKFGLEFSELYKHNLKR
jgi:hypothetical protein